MEDVQEGRDEGKELQERKGKSWGQQGSPQGVTPSSHSALDLRKPPSLQLFPNSKKGAKPPNFPEEAAVQNCPELLNPQEACAST